MMILNVGGEKKNTPQALRKEKSARRVDQGAVRLRSELKGDIESPPKFERLVLGWIEADFRR